MTPPLELLAVEWLRFEKRCVLVMTERSPREWHCGRPDALGILPSRHMIEIEIKRTLADFRSNRAKDCMTRRITMPWQFPRQFYFLVPYHLSNRVGFELPAWAGLMRTPDSGSIQHLAVMVKAPLNNDAKRLSLKECVRAVGSLTNENIALRKQVWRQAERELEPMPPMQIKVVPSEWNGPMIDNVPIEATKDK